jgi:hypothetical protein
MNSLRFAFMDPTLRFLPIIGRRAIGDEEHPRTIISDAIATIAILALT